MMAKRKKLSPPHNTTNINNPFLNFDGETSPEESKKDLRRLFLFGEPSDDEETGLTVNPHTNTWLDAMEALDEHGDKSMLVALLKGPVPDIIAPHIGDLLDRWNLVRPKHKMRTPSYRLTDDDVAMNAAGDMRGPDRRIKERTYDAKRRAGRRVVAGK
jgi:hypothetical protein